MFVFQEKDILAETSCRLAFLPPWGFYTHAGFLTCCTTVGEGAIFILLQINVLLLQVIIFVSDFFKTSCDGKLIQTQTKIKPFYFPFRLKKKNKAQNQRKGKIKHADQTEKSHSLGTANTSLVLALNNLIHIQVSPAPSRRRTEISSPFQLQLPCDAINPPRTNRFKKGSGKSGD